MKRLCWGLEQCLNWYNTSHIFPSYSLFLATQTHVGVATKGAKEHWLNPLFLPSIEPYHLLHPPNLFKWTSNLHQWVWMTHDSCNSVERVATTLSRFLFPQQKDKEEDWLQMIKHGAMSWKSLLGMVTRWKTPYIGSEITKYQVMVGICHCHTTCCFLMLQTWINRWLRHVDGGMT